MPKLEMIDPEKKIAPEQPLAEKEKAALAIKKRIFGRNVALENELLNPENLTLEPERISELKEDLSQITEQTKSVSNILEEFKTHKADSYDQAMAA